MNHSDEHVNNSNHYFMGIDPGVSGGIAVIGSDGSVRLWEMPETFGDTADLFEGEFREAGIRFCVIELVGGFKGQGAQRSFKFGKNDGVLIGLLLANKIRHQELSPRSWMKGLGIRPRDKKPKNPKPGKFYPGEESERQFKTRLKGRAQQLFPGVEINLKTADALLMSEVARRIYVSGGI